MRLDSTISCALLTDSPARRYHQAWQGVVNVCPGRDDDPTATQLGIDPEAIEAALERNLTFPARWYSDPAIFDVELEHVFARSWQLVAHEARIANPGDHHVCRVAHVPDPADAGAAGELHGFVNVCRHRAYPVATEDGNRKTLQCAYHGWTYELDGCLRRAPRSEREPGFDRAEFSLVPVPSRRSPASCS